MNEFVDFKESYRSIQAAMARSYKLSCGWFPRAHPLPGKVWAKPTYATAQPQNQA